MVKVLLPGFYSSIQDLGRFGFQQYGVPYAGVMDIYAATLANLILGNQTNDAVIEMTITGAKLQFNCDTVICLAGADMSPRLNDIAIPMIKSIKIKTGDVLSFGKLNHGIRCYLAVLGGFKTEKRLQSRSMYKNVTEHFKLSKNDELNIDLNASYVAIKNASIKVKNDYLKSNLIPVFAGPEFQLLTKNQKEFLLKNDFSISKNNNRMAYQLQETLENTLEPIITSVVLPGTVQLTPSGNVIVLMRDSQTTGGYPRIFQLKETAINILAQKFTGDAIRFKLVSTY